MDVSVLDRFREEMAKLTILNDKAAKAFAIITSVINTAEAINKSAKKMPRYKLPRIAHAARRRRSLALGMMGIHAYMGAARTRSIITTPIPKYPSGGCMSGGIAIVGDNNQEEIINL